MRNSIAYLLYFILFVLYLVLVGVCISIPDELTLIFSLLGFNSALTLSVLIVDRQRYMKFYSSGYFSKLVSALISIFLVFCIFAIVNYLAYKNPKQLDLTNLQLNSLTAKSASIIKGIKDPLTFKVFSRKSELRLITPILELYRNENNLVSIDFIDAEIRPDLVAAYGITKSPQVIIEYKNKKEYITDNTELAYTNGIIKINRSKVPVVYFTTGHGELKFTDRSKTGISNLLQGLKQSNYVIKEIDLKLESELPSDLSALVIWGPKNDFSDNELKILDDFLGRKARLLVALDPNFQFDSLKDLRKTLRGHGVDINNDLVIDSLSHINGSSGTAPLVKDLSKEHKITRGITENVFFPLVSSIEKNISHTGTETSLAVTTDFPASWAEKNLSEVIKGKVIFSEKDDTKGPISVMSAFESLTSDGKKNKIVAIGNSTFVINQYSKFVNNFMLVSNSIAWLTNDGELASFNLPFGQSEPVFISAPQLGAIFYTVVIVIPIVFFTMAVFWYRRRRKL